MPILSEQCKPYLSVSLYRSTGGVAAEVPALLSSIREIARASAEQKGLDKPRFPNVGDPELEVSGTNLAWAHYAMKRPPSWLDGPGLIDVHNHLIVVAKRGDIYALLFSENSLRSTIARKIATATAGELAKIARLLPVDITKAFVEDKVRTLWLSGTHTRTSTKPDSKVLSGLELESSLDPLGDQSYYFSSVRSTMTLADQAIDRVVGASPAGGRIWMGPTRTWDEFANSLNLVLDRASNLMNDATRSDQPLPVLASPISSLDGIEEPYDIALIIPESVNAGLPDQAGDDLRLLEQFEAAARFVITPTDGSPNFEVDVFWGEMRLGRMAYEFQRNPTSEIRIKARKINGFDGDELDETVLQICRDPGNLTIYFDTGHTFSRGRFYETRFRDARFEDWEWVRMDRDQTVFKQEKPLDGKRFAVENTGNDEDWSLFGNVTRHWPNLDDRGEQTGWLVCDDGAMESADFIHIDDTAAPPQLTLIHVKGSGSESLNRGLSVSDYEVVVGQAVKNLRHIDRDLLRDKLEANANGVLRDAVWHNGVRQENRGDLLAMLNGLGSNLKKTVVIYQPRVRRSLYHQIRDHMDAGNLDRADVRRLQQLDALLLGARADCYSLGAGFVVISDGDDL